MSDHRPVDPAKVKRLQRLEEELKENLRRRKSQARSRRDGSGDAPGHSERVDKLAHPFGNRPDESESQP